MPNTISSKIPTAVITGASSGVGYEIAKSLVLNGFNVLICSRTLINLLSAQTQLQQLANKNKVYIKAVDVSAPNDVLSFSDFAKKTFFSIDVLVNNAGILGPIGLFEKNNLELWIQTININLIGSALITHAFLPLLKKSARGKIIQLASGSAAIPDPNFTAYAASKAGIASFVETIAMELKEENVDINAILPGAILTKFNDQRLEAGIENTGHSAWQASIEREKNGGDPIKNCIELVSFLASADSNGLSGKIISAQKDKWREFKGRIDEIQQSDKHVIRRRT